ncbi:MAG: rod shape-determining protein MreC [Bacteroidaceae bacterium]|jgi:rod shape-determining protein MreC|nr:rod shape-determining protein MreC [Bacteroidaceae bacterium]
MQHLLEFLRKYHYLLLFIALEILSLTLLVRFNNFQGNVWLSGANTAVASVNRWYLDVWSYLNLQSANQSLTSYNTRLQLENDRLREALLTLQADSARKASAVLRNLVDYETLPAKVISNSKGGSNSYIVIDRGQRHGVRGDMGVVSGNGVVGVVYLAGEEYSLVIPVMNNKSNISCRIQGQRYFGYLTWDGKDSRHAYVDDIPRHAHVEKGLTIETSGHSSVFPPGIFVGTIETVENSADGQSYKLGLLLGTDFANLRDVNVITTPYKAAVDSLFKKAAAEDELHQ